MHKLVKSYAKINLFLKVLNRRQDGYHNIDTLFQTISLHDQMVFEESGNEDFQFECNIKTIENEDNIIWKVIQLLQFKIPKDSKGLRIRLEKIIPMGAGLGGGSSNAACALKMINQHYQLGLTKNDLIQIGSKLGADVPLFIQGGLARGEGIGDKLTFYNDQPNFLYYVIVYPNIHSSTKDAYDGINLSSIENQKYSIDELLNGIRNHDHSKVYLNIYNHFEDTIFKKYPILNNIKNELIKSGADTSLMSGSGSSMLGIFHQEDKAIKSYNILKDSDYQVFLAQNQF